MLILAVFENTEEIHLLDERSGSEIRVRPLRGSGERVRIGLELPSHITATRRDADTAEISEAAKIAAERNREKNRRAAS